MVGERAKRPRKRVNKFNARRVKRWGITFDSDTECKRFGLLRQFEDAGHIYCLTAHPEFELLSQDGEYLGLVELDAGYWMPQRGFFVEDTKANEGLITPLARWKFKHFEADYGVPVILVFRDGLAKVPPGGPDPSQRGLPAAAVTQYVEGQALEEELS